MSRPIITLAAGHGCADLCQGAIPALVPFLVVDRGLSYAQTGALVLVMSVTSSVVQPLIGMWSDRRRASWPVPVGVLLAGAGIAAFGAVSSFLAMAALTAVAGLGVALFHPDGARRAAGGGSGKRLSVFAVGGSAGFALAPVLLTPAVLIAGLPGTVVVLLPTLVVGVALTRVPDVGRAFASDHGVAARDADRPGAFVLLTFVAALRAGAYFAPQAFLAAALITRLDVSTAQANVALAAFLIAGAIGTLVGGHLADRISNRAVIIGSLVATVPAVVLVLEAPTPALAIVAASLLGFTVVASYSATILLGQELLASRPSLAAGTTLGLAIGAGGVIVATLGLLADVHGPQAALWVVAGIAILGAALATALPSAPRLR